MTVFGDGNCCGLLQFGYTASENFTVRESKGMTMGNNQNNFM